MILVSLSSPIIEDPIDPTQAQFEMNVPERNRYCAQYHKKYGKHIVVNGKDAYNISILDTRSIAFVEDDTVLYLCYYREYRNKKYKYAIQQIVWQHESNKGFAQKMIDWFLSQYDYLMLSDTQYPKGVAMYTKYVRNNIGTVYIYIKYQNKYLNIANVNQFDSLIKQIWSKNDTHKNVRLIFSNDVLEFT